MPNQQFIDPRTHTGVVSLTVADLARSLRFYRDVLGLAPAERSNNSALLAAGDTPLLYLVELPGAQPKPPRSTGLYHFAILLPSRPELGLWLRHVLEIGWPLQGWSDHGVSEAIYLADPDGNGIEIYRDRPRSEWPVLDGALQLTTDPLDAQGLLALAGSAAPSGYVMPAGAVMGHVHLHVASIPQAQAFYCDVLGFDLAQRYGPSALFVSAGGYHHHIGLNTWAGVGAPPAPAGSAGLRYFTVLVPDDASLASLVRRVEGAGIPVVAQDGGWQLQDPSGNGIRLLVSPVG